MGQEGLILLKKEKNLFVFVSWFTKQNLHFGITIFWVSGKNSIMRNKNCIDFPKHMLIHTLRNHLESYHKKESFAHENFA